MARNAEAINHVQKVKTIIHSNADICQSIERNVERFLSVREDLLANSKIQELSAYKDDLFHLLEGSRIEQLKARVASKQIHLAFCGENSSGKSAFIQTFLGIGKILPSGDGPVTARITKLTYAPNDQAGVYIRRTLRDPTLVEDVVSLASYFAGGKSDWTAIAGELSKHLKRPADTDESTDAFADWARALVEVRIPSPILALGIDVYDTPGFLMDDAPVLREILRDLVEFVHPTIVFMYANPCTEDATKSCFIAMKAALHHLDSSSIFFLNSKADIPQMKRFKKNMDMTDFLTVLADERTRRYGLLLNAPFLQSNRLEGLPPEAQQCSYFDLCSVNSQIIKPFGPQMNETTIQHIIEFVANNDLTVAKRVCNLVLPIIDAFFHLIHLTSSRTSEQLAQIRYDAMSWEKSFFEFYAQFTEKCLEDLFTNIFKTFAAREESIVQLFRSNRKPPESLELLLESTVRVGILGPVISDTLRTFMNETFMQMKSSLDLAGGGAFNEILLRVLAREEINDFTAMLLDDRVTRTPASITVLYMMNTVSTPIVQCARNLRELNLSDQLTKDSLVGDFRERLKIFQGRGKEKIDVVVRRHLVEMQAMIEEQREISQQAVRLWGEQQSAVLRSLIDRHYQTISPTLASHQQILNGLEQYFWELISIECELRAAKDLAQFNGAQPQIQSDHVNSTVFSIFPASWGNKSHLTVKKLTEPIPDQPNASWYEAHYHLKMSNFSHPNIGHLLYLYKNHLDDQTSEMWMIFAPLSNTLEQLLQQSTTVLPLRIVVRWLSEIADALATLHRNELVHRNVTLSNIVISEDERATLVDLGNWNESCDLRTRHKLSANSHDIDEDIRGLAGVGLGLCTFVAGEKESSVIFDEVYELMRTCAEASLEKPLTTETIQRRLKFVEEMF